MFSRAAFAKEPLHGQSLGVEAIHAALLLGEEPALERMWSLQIKEGKEKGAWDWFHLDLDPWETPQSNFYGAALAALAVKNASEEHRARHREQIAMLVDYLKREQGAQPLHNRLMLLWAMPEALADQQALIDEVWKKQLARWRVVGRVFGTLEQGLRGRREATRYATGFAAYVLLIDHNRSA